MHTRGDVCVEVLPGEPRRVPVDALVLGHRDLVQESLVLAQHSRVVHHLTQAQHPFLPQERVQVEAAQMRAARLEIRRRDARREHHEYVDRTELTGIQDVVNALDAVNVRYLVRVTDDRGGAARDDRPRELLDLHHRALQVHVAVDESGQHEAPLEIYLLLPRVVPYPHDPLTEYGDVPLVDLGGEDVDDASVPEHEVRLHVASRNPDYLGKLFHVVCAILPRGARASSGPTS